MSDRLAPILARKRGEVERRLRRHDGVTRRREVPATPDALRRGAGPPRVIAEIKFRSPSVGAIRPWQQGEGRRVARAYEGAGASAISVLCDRAGFGGCPLELRRIAGNTALPVLFKEFVLDPVQLDLAAAVGASYVLLLVRALDAETLAGLVAGCTERGLVPVVEAADAREVDLALATGAAVVGVNARDLSTFEVDPAAAQKAIARIPEDRVAVYMSGVSEPEDLRAVAAGRCDAVLVGTSLMRATDPGRKLAALIGAPT